jgi:hypothetical protein
MVDEQEQQQHRVNQVALWYGALGGMIAWTLHILLAYLIAEFGCETGQDVHVYAGVMLPAWLLLGMSATMIVLSAGSIASAYACLKRIRTDDGDSTLRSESEHYLARAGVISGALFTFIIVIQTIPTFSYLSGC